MNADEKLIQQKIGRQLMLINMFITIGDQECRIGISQIDISDMAIWAEMDEDEIKTLTYYYRYLSRFESAFEVAKELVDIKNKDLFRFYFKLLIKLGKIYYILRRGNKEKDFTYEIVKETAEVIVRDYELKIPEEHLKQDSVMEAFNLYFEQYSKVVKEAFNEGYDRVVVEKLITLDLDSRW